MRSVDPQTLSVTHIVDGEEVVTGGDDGQRWVATFFDQVTAELFIQWCREKGAHPGGQRTRELSRLRTIEAAALRVASSRRNGIVKDQGPLDALDAALEGR